MLNFSELDKVSKSNKSTYDTGAMQQIELKEQRSSNLLQQSTKKSKKFIICIILVVLSVVGGGYYLLTNNNQSNVDNSKIRECNSLETTYYGDEVERCIGRLAIVENNEEYCEILDGKYGWGSLNIGATCYSDLAFMNGDYKHCENIEGRYSEIIKKECYLAVAFHENNTDICNMSNDKDYCYSWMANIKNSPNICNLIGDKVESEECFNRFDKNMLTNPKDALCEGVLTMEAEKTCNEIADTYKSLYAEDKPAVKYDEKSKSNYTFCGVSYLIEVKEYEEESIKDIAELYADLANKEEGGLFCNEFSARFDKNNLIGIVLEDYEFGDPDKKYKKIKFYDIYSDEYMRQPNSGFDTSLNKIENQIKYAPENGPKELTENTTNGSYTKAVILGSYNIQ